MITGEIKNKIDQIWNAFAAGGIVNPLTVIEQITYLLFIRRLDEIQTTKEKQARHINKKIENTIFTAKQKIFRWSYFKDLEPNEILNLFIRQDGIFAFIKNMNKNGESSYARFMKDAVFMITNPALLDKVISMLDEIPMQDRDTKGDLYEYLLSKLTTAGRNGQFRTPRHIIKMMVELTSPKPDDIIGDPASGTCGFLMSASEYLRKNNEEMLRDKKQVKHFLNSMFTAYDSDVTMCRIGAMNLFLHGIENPTIEQRDSLSNDYEEEDVFTLVLANPPFKGSLDFDSTSKSLQQMVKTKKTELLFLGLFLRLLKPGGRCACIVPDGVLFGSSNAHKQIRKTLIDGHKLDAIISMPSGVFKPYAGVSTAVLVFTKTNSGGTDNVWFYDMQADGFSLDDKRTLLDENKHENNNIPDIIKRWSEKEKELKRKRTEQSFMVPVKEIIDNEYDLSINRYKEIVYEEVKYAPPKKIIGDLEKLEKEIQTGLAELKGMVK